MRVGIISSKDVFSAGRMDAGFHLTRKSLIEDGSLARAEEAYSSDEALAILKSLPSDMLNRVTHDLVRGAGVGYGIERALQEYPHMALALAFRDEEADRVISEKAAELQAKAEALAKVGSALRRRP